jgi:hypothetical protein
MEAVAASVIAKGTASGWTLCVVSVIAVVVLLKILAAQRPKMKEMEIDAREADFERLRVEIATLKADHKETLEAQNARISKVEAEAEGARREAETAKEHAMRSDGKLQSALTACEVLLGLVEREMPDAKEIPLVKRLLAQAATSDMGVGDGIRKLAAVRGRGE